MADRVGSKAEEAGVERRCQGKQLWKMCRMPGHKLCLVRKTQGREKEDGKSTRVQVKKESKGEGESGLPAGGVRGGK